MTWWKDHRPQTLDSIVGQPTDRIQAALDSSREPNFLFYGPPGTGKTTTARAIARHLHGDTDNLVEINASDERGIDTIRDRIKRHARRDVGTQMTLDMSVPVIYLDEVDGLTDQAQDALKSPLEDSAAIFVLSTNRVEDVQPALRSRCMERGYEFGPVSVSDVVDRLSVVAAREGVEIDRSRLVELAKRSDGDMRSALDMLEQEYRFGATPGSASDNEVDPETVKEYL